jgi:hypothetical protein
LANRVSAPPESWATMGTAIVVTKDTSLTRAAENDRLRRTLSSPGNHSRSAAGRADTSNKSGAARLIPETTTTAALLAT